jgi:serine/threonine protein kinase
VVHRFRAPRAFPVSILILRHRNRCITRASSSHNFAPYVRYEFQRLHQYRPYSLKAVRSICRQTLEALSFMHSLELVHTDIKPENICLVSGEPDPMT